VILYSIVPGEVVFEYNENPVTSFLEMEYLGEKVVVSQTDDNKYVICRLISTSPKAYLDPRLQPGMVIERSFPNGKNQ